MRRFLNHIGLVKLGVTIQLALSGCQILIRPQLSHVKTAACHLLQLVHQHVARGADFACKTGAFAQHHSLGESAAVGEFGEVQIDALDTV